MRYTDKQWGKVDLGDNSYQYYPCGLVFKGGFYNGVYIAKDQPNAVSSIYEVVINSEKIHGEMNNHIDNRRKFSHCRSLSGARNPGLIFTAVNSYENIIDFYTWLIVMKKH